MKRVLLTLLLCFACFPGAAHAGWAWAAQANGQYLWTDGTSNDGWYYNRTCDSRGCCSFTKAQPYVAKAKAPAYGPDWKVEGIRAMNEQKDRDLYRDFIDSFNGQPSSGQAASSPGYSTSGVATYAQGFAPVGSTAYGYGGAGNPAFQINVQDLQHTEGQLLTRLTEIMGQKFAHHQANNAQLGAAAAEIEKMRVIGNAIVEGAKAAQPPRTEQYQWNTQPVAPAGGGGERPVVVGAAVARVRGRVALATNCATCHNGHNDKTKLDLSEAGLATLDPARKSEVYKEARKRMFAEDAASVMPPPDKGAMPEASKLEVLSGLLD